MEYKIVASSVFESAQLARLIMAWYTKPKTGPSVRSSSVKERLSPQKSEPRAQNHSPTIKLASSHPIIGKEKPHRMALHSTGHINQIRPATISNKPISTRPSISQTATEFDIAPGLRLRRVSSLGDLNHDYFFWQDNRVLVVDLFSGQHRWVKLKAGWDGSRQGTPAPVSLGDYTPNQITSKSVASMTTFERLAEALKRAAYKGPDYLKQAILDLISPENLAIIAVFAAAQATPFGWVADAVAIVSAVWAFKGRVEQVYALGKAVAEFIDLTLNATTDAELDRAADAFIIIATTSFDLLKAIITKRGGKLRRGESRDMVTTRNKGGGNTPDPKIKPHVEEPLPPKAKPKTQNKTQSEPKADTPTPPKPLTPDEKINARQMTKEEWKKYHREQRINEAAKNTAPNLRDKYKAAIEGLKSEADELMKQGKTDEDIARIMVDRRRELTIEYKKITPPDLLEFIYKMNIMRYKNKGLGDKYGLNWEGTMKLKKGDYKAIIKGAYTTGTPRADVDPKKQLGQLLQGFFKDNPSSDEYKRLMEVLEKYDML